MCIYIYIRICIYMYVYSYVIDQHLVQHSTMPSRPCPVFFLSSSLSLSLILSLSLSVLHVEEIDKILVLHH